MAKNVHALIFVALKGANFTEVETIFDGMRSPDPSPTHAPPNHKS